MSSASLRHGAIVRYRGEDHVVDEVLDDAMLSIRPHHGDTTRVVPAAELDELADPTWNTHKGHGRPARLMFHGGNRGTRMRDGRLVTATVEHGMLELRDPETHQVVYWCGVAGKFWAAPAAVDAPNASTGQR